MFLHGAPSEAIRVGNGQIGDRICWLGRLAHQGHYLSFDIRVKLWPLRYVEQLRTDDRLLLEGSPDLLGKHKGLQDLDD